MKSLRYAFVSLLFHAALFAQQAGWDTLNVQYRLLQTNYEPYEDIIKIKVPPHLSTREVMEQVKLVIQWPGSPPPRKKTTVYVFKDADPKGTRSKTGAVYRPGKGYRWDMRDWQPDLSIYQYNPRDRDKTIYNTLLDSMFVNGFFALEFEEKDSGIKDNVAKNFDLTVAELDSIYYRVKWWCDLNKPVAK